MCFLLSFIHSQILSLSTVQSQNNLSLSHPLSFILSLSPPPSPSLPPSLPAARAPQFTLHPANVTVNERANFILNCSAIGLPAPTIVLLDNGLIVPEFKAEKIGNGVYQFSDVRDDSGPGDYVCRATNDFGVALSYTATVVVRCK
jgi:hypothetical protein